MVGSIPLPPGNKFIHSTQMIPLSIWQRSLIGLKIFLNVFCTLGLVFAWASSRDRIKSWYDECRSGKRKITVLSPKPIANLKEFLECARIDPYSITDLSKWFNEALKNKERWNSIERTTFFHVAEVLSKQFLSKGKNKEAFQVRIEAARAVPPETEFANLGITPPKGDPHLGYRLQPLGTSSIKNQTIKVQKREYNNGKKCIRIEARLQDFARKDLEKTLDALKAEPELLSGVLPSDWIGVCVDDPFSSNKIVYHGREKANDTWGKKFTEGAPFTLSTEKNREIEFFGIGKVFVGANPACHTEYKHLTIELDPNISEQEAGEKLHIIFAALGLGSISSHSRPEDIERIKVMQLFRQFFPIQSNHDQFKNFEGSLENLKGKITKAQPNMKDKFHHYLEQFPQKMYREEVSSGQFVWCIDGLAQEAKNLGAKILMSTTSQANSLASLLKMGALSSQERMSAGITFPGLSTDSDFKTGGAESIFTTLITEKTMNQISISNFTYKGTIKIFYDLKLVERVGYTYSSDCFGAKDHRYIDPHHRHNIQGLVKKLNNLSDNYSLTSNEVCIHGCISPEHIKGILVNTIHEKKSIVDNLIKENVIENGCINHIPIDNFIKVANFAGKYQEKHWT